MMTRYHFVLDDDYDDYLYVYAMITFVVSQAFVGVSLARGGALLIRR